MIALRNGGYKNNAKYVVEGVSGEDVFEERLMNHLILVIQGKLHIMILK